MNKFNAIYNPIVLATAATAVTFESIPSLSNLTEQPKVPSIPSGDFVANIPSTIQEKVIPVVVSVDTLGLRTTVIEPTIKVQNNMPESSSKN